MATHSSIIAWRIPWTEEPGRLQSMGSRRVGHDRRDLACAHTRKFNRISCVLAIWVSSLMKGLFSTFPIFFFYIYIIYIFLIDFEKLFILYDCFLLVTDIVNIYLEGLSFHYLLLNNMEKELSKCSYVKRLCVIKKSLVSQFNLYNLIYILPK